ncbi:MAG: ABC transporter substrate-binding protein, partial [Micrococcales bacterium]|nr:ABC transporter substrate-binding protein [Micrococcales bacterium]
MNKSILTGTLLALVPLLVACAGNTTPPSPEPGSPTPSASATGAMSSSPVRVAALKGPTTMGMVGLMDQASKNQTAQQYTFDIEGTPDAVSGPLAAGNLDVALIPVNLAAVLYNKTNGGVKLAAVNTLGVLYVVTGDPAVTSLS